jgi:hypothetical protein
MKLGRLYRLLLVQRLLRSQQLLLERTRTMLHWSVSLWWSVVVLLLIVFGMMTGAWLWMAVALLFGLAALMLISMALENSGRLLAMRRSMRRKAWRNAVSR